MAWRFRVSLKRPRVGSASSRRLDLSIPRFPEIEQRDYGAGLLDIGRSGNRHAFGVRWAGQQLDDNHSQASFRTPVMSTLDRQDDFNVVQGSWRMAVSPQLLLEARAGLARANLNGKFQATGGAMQSGLDLFTNFRSGMAPFEDESTRTRFSRSRADIIGCTGLADFCGGAGLARTFAAAAGVAAGTLPSRAATYSW